MTKPHSEPPLDRSTGKVIILFMLYLSQGLPFGFQTIALPLYLRAEGVTLTAIGLAGALSLPWMLKALWAPLVDRWSIPGMGRRKSWILPMQALMIAAMLAGAWADPSANLRYLLGSVFLMNLFAATQDIAVDGLAVDILKAKDLGHGNAAQVVGYKAGMLLSGGLLVWLSSYYGWRGLFLLMAAVALIPFIMLAFYREHAPDTAPHAPRIDLGAILARAGAALGAPGAWRLVLFIGTYKLGEVMIDAMFKPFLVDCGFTPQVIGLWMGTYGMAASIGGSLAGGILSSRIGVFRGLAISALLRIFPLAMEWWLSLGVPGPAQVIGVTAAEHFFGGMLTTALFAYMMSRVDRTIGATHYTILASIEVFGKSPGSWASGFLAERMGYPGLFGLGTVISMGTLGLLWGLRERPIKASPEGFR
jgi:MFS transporter, PAT family, beta-lactamase induction signal transducer AmpG